LSLWQRWAPLLRPAPETRCDIGPKQQRARSSRASERATVSAESFEIVVRGRLTPTLIVALDGFEVSRYAEGFTYLVGWVPDQARLYSLLGVLRDLNIELKSVNAVEMSSTDASVGPQI
jgi:hypothetical protein